MLVCPRGAIPLLGRLRAANGNRLNKWVKEASYRRSMSTAALLKNKTIIWCSPSGCQRRRSFPTWRCSPRWPIAAGWLFQESGARELLRHRGQTDGSEFSDKCWQSGSRPALHKSAFCNGNRDKARRAIGGFLLLWVVKRGYRNSIWSVVYRHPQSEAPPLRGESAPSRPSGTCAGISRREDNKDYGQMT